MKIDQLFKAFADENRLRILHLLSEEEQCVCDLMTVLKMGQSKVSRHLSYLKKAGLVKHRKDGLWAYYSMVNPQSEFHKKLLTCFASCLDEVPSLQKDRQRLKENKRNKKVSC